MRNVDNSITVTIMLINNKNLNKQMLTVICVDFTEHIL